MGRLGLSRRGSSGRTEVERAAAAVRGKDAVLKKSAGVLGDEKAELERAAIVVEKRFNRVVFKGERPKAKRTVVVTVDAGRALGMRRMFREEGFEGLPGRTLLPRRWTRSRKLTLSGRCRGLFWSRRVSESGAGLANWRARE